MKKLFVIDEHDYDPDMQEITRTSVRGIIMLNGKLLFIQSASGEVKFPGGGMEKGESDIDTLVRETLEETGRHVIAKSAVPFGETEEKRLSVKEPMIWHLTSRFYFCDVDDREQPCSFTPSEMKHGFKRVWYTIDEALSICEGIKGERPRWSRREYEVLKLLKGAEDNKQP